MIRKIENFLALGLVPNIRLYVTALPLVLLASVASFSDGSEPEMVVGQLAANLLSLLVVALVFALGSMLLTRASGSALLLLAGFGLLLGVAKQLSTAWFEVLLGLSGSFLDSAVARPLTPLLGIWLVFALAALEATRKHFGAMREELIAERVRSASRGFDNHQVLAKFADEASRLLKTAEPTTAAELAGLIRSLVANQLRPLSHQLWDREKQATPGFTWRELVVRALQQRPYRSFLILVVYSLGSFTPLAEISSQSFGLALGLFCLGTISALVLSNFLRRRSELAKRQFGLTLVTTVVASVIASYSLLTMIGIESTLLLWISSAWWLGTLIVVIGVVVVAIEDHQEQREMFSKLASVELDDEAGRYVRAIRNRELANLLHSKTQNRMLAQAMRLESGGDLGEELADLRQFLAGLPSQRVESVSPDQLRQRWGGVLDLTFDLDRDCSELLMAVIEEAVSNSFRHGRASSVSIQLKDDVLIVTDNGLGPVRGRPGLGSKLMDSVGTWQLSQASGGGAVLNVELSDLL